MKLVLLSSMLINIFTQVCIAGPPFLTDDPQPVDFKHWEFYISSVNTRQQKDWSGTSPHIEVNYGIVPDVQIHLLLPVNYHYVQHEYTHFGYANTEFGIKYRFIQESDDSPQIGTFPIIEISTINNSEFGNGYTQIYLPIWMQKSWGKYTTYGGAGYWINPGINNKNWIFAGWEVQYDFSTMITLGGELYYHTADANDSRSVTGFNMGGSINFSSKTHFIFSLGRNVAHQNFFSSYIGMLWTI